jgi:hypothetical protein
MGLLSLKLQLSALVILATSRRRPIRTHDERTVLGAGQVNNVIEPPRGL